MKRIVFLLIIICNSLQGYCQKKVAYGLMLSPSIEELRMPDFPYPNKRKLSYNFGLKTKVALSKKLYLNTGLIVYNKGRVYTTYYPVRLSQNIWYASIPVTIENKIVLTNKLKFTVAAGIIYGRKVWDFFFQENPDGHRFYTPIYTGTAKNYVGCSIGMGMNYQLSERISFDLKPSYIRQLNPALKDEKSKLNSYLLEYVL